MPDELSNGSSEIAALAQRVETARGKLPLQLDPALLDVLSEREIAAERELAEWIRAQRRKQRRGEIEAELAAEERDRKSAAALRRSDEADARWHRRALAARRRVSSQDARLAQLYRRAEWSSRALISVVVLGMVWAGINVQHNLVPSGDMSDPLYWLSYGIEAMISIPIITIMVAATTAARWGRELARGKVIFFETALLGTTIALNAGPHLAAGDLGRAAEYAIAPVMVGVVIWLHAWVSARYAILIDGAPVVEPDQQTIRLDAERAQAARLSGGGRYRPADSEGDPAHGGGLSRAGSAYGGSLTGGPAAGTFSHGSTDGHSCPPPAGIPDSASTDGHASDPPANWYDIGLLENPHGTGRPLNGNNAPRNGAPRGRNGHDIAPENGQKHSHPGSADTNGHPVRGHNATYLGNSDTGGYLSHGHTITQTPNGHVSDHPLNGHSLVHPENGSTSGTPVNNYAIGYPVESHDPAHPINSGAVPRQEDNNAAGRPDNGRTPAPSARGRTNAPISGSPLAQPGSTAAGVGETAALPAHPAVPSTNGGPTVVHNGAATGHPDHSVSDGAPTPSVIDHPAASATDYLLDLELERPTRAAEDSPAQSYAAAPNPEPAARAGGRSATSPEGPAVAAPDNPGQVPASDLPNAFRENSPVPQQISIEEMRNELSAEERTDPPTSGEAPVSPSRATPLVLSPEQPAHARFATGATRQEVAETMDSPRRAAAAADTVTQSSTATQEDSHSADIDRFSEAGVEQVGSPEASAPPRPLPGPEPVPLIDPEESHDDEIPVKVEEADTDDEISALARAITGRRLSNLPIEEVREILTLADQGGTTPGIANELGVSRAAVTRVLDSAIKVHRPYAITG